MVAENDVARLLAADIAILFAHRLEDVAVADLGADEADAFLLQPAFKAEIGHDSRDHRAAAKLFPALQIQRHEGHHLVAVDDPSVLVDHDQPVRISIERDPDVRAAGDDGLLQDLRVSRPTAGVDVEPVRLHAEGDNVGAQLPQGLGSDVVGGAVSAIDDDLEAVEPKPFRESRLHMVDIATAGIVDAPRAPDLVRRDELYAGLDLPLDRLLGLVAELVAVRSEQLDAIVRKGIVRGGDHYADVGPH